MSNHAHPAYRLLALAVFATAYSAVAHAADNARYVSITGSNANTCTLAAPCRTLQRGISLTPPGGELRILNSGFYGNNANVRKSLTISGNGKTVYLGARIVIDDADAVVALRGLVLDGQGTVSDGIRINAAATVHIERCVIHGYAQHGISASDGVELFVLDSIVRDNAAVGLLNQADALRLTIDNSQFNNNLSGVVLQGGQVTIRRSVASGNLENGIAASLASVSVISTMAVQNGAGFSAGSGTMTIESSTAHGNLLVGLFVNRDATVRISNSTFTDNGTGISNFGTVQTRQNNTVTGNGTDTAGIGLTPLGGT